MASTKSGPSGLTMFVVDVRDRGFGQIVFRATGGAVIIVALPGRLRRPKTACHSMGLQDHVEPDHEEWKPRQDWEAERRSR